MAEASINYEEGAYSIRIFRVKIDERRIMASGKPWGTVLEFPLEWEPNPNWQNEGKRWEIINGIGNLAWRGGPILTPSVPIYPVNRQKPQQVEFLLFPIQAEELERLRNSGDAEFLLRLVFHMAMFTGASIQKPMSTSQITKIVTDELSLEANLSIDIPKSRYEEKILPELGLGGLGSITISMPPGLREVFPKALHELNSAQKTLQTAAAEEQFESVVVQSRNALLALLNQFPLELPERADGTLNTSFPNKVDALVDQHLKDTLSESQAEGVKKNLKALWRPYSGATKPGPPHHSRAYATYALHQAASHVKLISEVLWPKRKQS